MPVGDIPPTIYLTAAGSIHHAVRIQHISAATSAASTASDAVPSSCLRRPVRD